MAEDLLNLFTQGLSVSTDSNDTFKLHPRHIDYKGRHERSGDQSNRRKEVLDRHKRSRFDAINYSRKLADGDLNEKDFEEASMDVVEEKEVEKNGKKYNPYKNQLMLSEWVVDPPENLETDWIMVVCPIGKRVLIVAHKGHTTAYTKGGYTLNKFPSLLPGGSFKSWHRGAKNANNSFTLLDCIFDEINQTYWILDLMCLKGNPIYDSETDFRFFWMNSKLLEDCPGITQKSKVNPYTFKPCPHVPCTKSAIVNTITDMHEFQIDGVLFYHRLSHYRPGRSPLVGWLKAYMIQDILGIPMPLSVMEKAPIEFNKTILKDANKELQNTTSDRSFNNPKISPLKNKQDKNSSSKQDKDSSSNMDLIQNNVKENKNNFEDGSTKKENIDESEKKSAMMES